MGNRDNKGRPLQPGVVPRVNTLDFNDSQEQGYAQQGQRYTRTAAANAMNAQAYSRNNPSYNRKRNGMSTGKKAAIIIASLVAVLLVFGGIVAYLFIDQVNANLRNKYTDKENLEIQEKLVPVVNVNEPFYMMLIGSDERAYDEGMGARSDSNIVVRVDPVNWTVTMVSIPRDTKITYRGSTMKFNAVYSYGKAAGSIDAASNLLDVKISHYAEIDFDGLTNMVDAIGGVEIDVPQPINDPQAGQVTIDKAGLQTLNGDQALVFARSRHYYMDGDFSRAGNQRTLIEAIVKKVLSLPVGDIPGAVQALSKCVSTDLTVNQIYSLAMQYKNSGKEMTIYSAMVPSHLADIDGVSYVVADRTDLAKMMDLVAKGEDPNTVELSSGAAIGGQYEHYDYYETGEG